MLRALFVTVFSLLLLTTPAMAADSWATYSNPEYGFSVELPGTVTVEDIPTGDAEVTYRLFSVSDDRRFYGVAVIRLPDGYAYDLDDGAAGEVALNKGTIVSKEPVTVQGFPGRKVKYVSTVGGAMSTNWFVVVKTPAGAFSVVASQYGPGDPQEIDRVLNSFKLIP